jgi:hypothetical protein
VELILAQQGVLVLVYAVGALLALLYRDRYPRRAMLALVGSAILFAGCVVSTMGAFLSYAFGFPGLPGNLVGTLCQAGGFVVVIVAALHPDTRRQVSVRQRPSQQEPTVPDAHP